MVGGDSVKGYGAPVCGRHAIWVGKFLADVRLAPWRTVAEMCSPRTISGSAPHLLGAALKVEQQQIPFGTLLLLV